MTMNRSVHVLWGAPMRALWVTWLMLMAGLASAEPGFPFRLYDTHAHFYVDDLVHYPLHAEKAYMGADKMKEIVLSRPSSKDRVLALWDQHGVEAGVGVQYSAAYDTDNRYLLDVAASERERVRPVVILSLSDSQAPALLARMAKEQGVVGLRMPISRDGSGTFPWLDSDTARALWATADRLHLVVVLFPPLRGEGSRATADALVARVPALARRFPQVRIVLDHMGWPEVVGAPDFGFNPLYQAMALPNVYLKLTTVNLLAIQAQGIATDAFVLRAVERFGADHVMWGSDQGNTARPYEDMVALAHASAAKLSPEQARQVFRETAMRVFAGR
jgi:L-fuconolactonase